MENQQEGADVPPQKAKGLEMANTKTHKRKPLERTVAETIDFVYEYLRPFPDGCEFSAKDTGNQGREVVRTLLRRGIISMKKMHNGKARYAWVAEMAPTKVLYQSVAAEIRDSQREKNKKYSASKASAKPSEEPAVNEPEDAPVEPVQMEAPKVNILECFSAQELWDELKARGYVIEDNRLVVVKKAYLD